MPRIIWSNRPHLSFNHYITNAIWGEIYTFSESPIGRIGESFFVLYWMGIVYAIFYALLWHFIFNNLIKKSDNELKHMLYFTLLCLIVIPDAYIIYNLIEVIVILILFFVINNFGKNTSSNRTYTLLLMHKSKSSLFT